jgi:hypothetical protein
MGPCPALRAQGPESPDAKGREWVGARGAGRCRPTPRAPKRSAVLIPAGIEIDPQGAGKRFFLKKEAKTFAYSGARWTYRAPKGSKFFGSFFQKRTASLYPV